MSKVVCGGGPGCPICQGKGTGDFLKPHTEGYILECRKCGYSRPKQPIFYDRSPILDGWDWQPEAETQEDDMGITGPDYDDWEEDDDD